MKTYINSAIEGKPFFKRYILFLIPILILAVITQRTDDTMPLLSTLTSLGESYLTVLLYLAFFCYAIGAVTFKDKGFAFAGSVGEGAPKFLKWYLITVITIGIYSPWYIRNMADYYLERTDYDGRSGELLSSPGTLLKYLLLTLYLPLTVLTVVFVFFMYRGGYMYNGYGWFSAAGPIFVFVAAIFLIIIPFMYFYFAWILHVRFGEFRTAFRRGIGETAAFLIPQLLLSLITLFIYYPAACVRIYRFLLEGTEYQNDDGTMRGGFGFDGTTSKGFGLLWGQGLLTIITAGIYGPWAMAKLTNWFLSNTFIGQDGGPA